MFGILVKGGWMMIPLAACSLVAVTIIIDRMMFFKRIGTAHPGEEVIAAVRQGKIDEALNIIDQAPGTGRGAPLPIMRILSAGITHRSDPEGAMGAAGVGELSLMKRGLVALDTIITALPSPGPSGDHYRYDRFFQGYVHCRAWSAPRCHRRHCGGPDRHRNGDYHRRYHADSL